MHKKQVLYLLSYAYNAYICRMVLFVVENGQRIFDVHVDGFPPVHSFLYDEEGAAYQIISYHLRTKQVPRKDNPEITTNIGEIEAGVIKIEEDGKQRLPETD